MSWETISKTPRDFQLMVQEAEEELLASQVMPNRPDLPEASHRGLQPQEALPCLGACSPRGLTLRTMLRVTVISCDCH